MAPGYADLYKMWLGHDRDLRKWRNWGDVYWVDATNGSDTDPGNRPGAPFKTLEKAIEEVTDNNNDVIWHKGYENLAAGITLDKDKTSILGWGYMGSNPYYPEIGSIDRSVAEDAPVLGIEAEFCEIAGLAFNANFTTPAASNAPLELMDGAANKAYIHDCFFPDWGRATMMAGIRLDGCHYVVIEDCVFQSVYGNIDAGIYIESSAGMPAYGKIKRCSFMGGPAAYAMAYGINDIVGMSYGEFEDLSFQGCTYGIGLPAAKDIYSTVKGIVGTMAKADIFESATATDDTIAHLTTNWKMTVADCWGNDGPLTT